MDYGERPRSATTHVTRLKVFSGFIVFALVSCGSTSMAPNPDRKETLQRGRATAEKHSVTGAITLRWATDPDDQPALILATTDAAVELTGADTIAVGALSPYTWTPEDTSRNYFFTVLPQGGAVIDTFDWVAPRPDGPLEGQWHKPCGAVDAQREALGYDTVELVVTGAAYRLEAHFFADHACLVPANASRKYKGQLRLGETVRTPEGEQAKLLDAQSTGYPSTDLLRYTIFKVDEDTLRFGSGRNALRFFDGMSEDERPVSLDSHRVFTRIALEPTSTRAPRSKSVTRSPQ